MNKEEVRKLAGEHKIKYRLTPPGTNEMWRGEGK